MWGGRAAAQPVSGPREIVDNAYEAGANQVHIVFETGRQGKANQQFVSACNRFFGDAAAHHSRDLPCPFRCSGQLAHCHDVSAVMSGRFFD